MGWSFQICWVRFWDFCLFRTLSLWHVSFFTPTRPLSQSKRSFPPYSWSSTTSSSHRCPSSPTASLNNEPAYRSWKRSPVCTSKLHSHWSLILALAKLKHLGLGLLLKDNKPQQATFVGPVPQMEFPRHLARHLLLLSYRRTLRLFHASLSRRKALRNFRVRLDGRLERHPGCSFKSKQSEPIEKVSKLTRANFLDLGSSWSNGIPSTLSPSSASLAASWDSPSGAWYPTRSSCKLLL